MRGGLLLVALCACNQVFGLKDTSLRDAAFFDMPPRGPAMCPAIGTPPAFTNDIHQLDAAHCSKYVTSTDTNLAMAACAGSVISQGPLDAALLPSTFLPATTSTRDDPRMFPEGTSVIVRQFQPSYEFQHYHLDPSGAWTSPVALSLASSFTSTLGTPSRGPDRRIMYVTVSTATSQYQAQEMAEGAPDVWTPVGAPYTYAELGAGAFNTMNLTADGLRLVTIGATAAAPQTYDIVLYTERPSLSARFGPVVQIGAVPTGAYDAYLTEDCGRLYFSALDSVYCVQQ